MEFVSMDLVGEFHPLIKRKQVCTNSSLYAYRIYPSAYPSRTNQLRKS